MLALAIYAAVVTECSQHTSALKPVGGILLRPWPVATTATLIVIGSVSTLQLAWLPSL
jgi:hypothetical protein